MAMSTTQRARVIQVNTLLLYRIGDMSGKRKLGKISGNEERNRHGRGFGVKVKV
jgi:hypothetical protein